MDVFLAGLWDDGTGLPLPPRRGKSVQWVRSASGVIFLDVANGAGAPLDLTQDQTAKAVLTVKRSTLDGSPSLRLDGAVSPARGPGRFDFTFTPASTLNLEPGRYVYDVWVTVLGQRNAVLLLAPFVLEASANLS